MSTGTIVGVIPARGESRGIPRKNIKLMAGKPLIAYCIEQAQQSKYITAIYVSTEDHEVASVAQHFGAPVIMQPRETATDRSLSESALLHFAQKVDFEVLVFFQCTSPFTLAQDIDGAVSKFFEGKYDSLLSVCDDHGGFLCGGFVWDEHAQSVNYDYRHRPRRQDRPPFYRENGAIYIMTKAGLLAHQNRLYGKIGLYVMPRERSFEIDSPADWEWAERILRIRSHKSNAIDARA